METFLGDSLLRRMLENIYRLPWDRTVPRGQKCIGFCVGGQTVNQLIRRLTNREEELASKDVIILIGTNDVLQLKERTPGQIRRVYRMLIRKVKRCGQRRIVLCTLPPLRRSQLQSQLINRYNAVIRDVATEEEIRLVDLYHIMDDRFDLLANDGIHHNRRRMCMIDRAIMQA